MMGLWKDNFNCDIRVFTRNVIRFEAIPKRIQSGWDVADADDLHKLMKQRVESHLPISMQQNAAKSSFGNYELKRLLRWLRRMVLAAWKGR